MTSRDGRARRLRIGFFQYELSHPNNAPHVGMCLLLADLRRAGHEVDAALVHAQAVDLLIDAIRDRAYDFVAFDAIFTVPVLDRVKAACPDVPILVGGNNALALMLLSRADFAIVGPARSAMLRFVEGVASETLPAGVPNLFVRLPDGRVDHSGVHADWAVHGELADYAPDLDWGYLGPSRAPGSNTRFASVVPEWGCAFQNDSLTGPAFDALERGGVSDVVSSLPLTDAARRAVQPYASNTRGCSFCAFRYQPYTIDRVTTTISRVIDQMTFLSTRYGVTEFSIQSENPFRFLEPLITALSESTLRVDKLLIRTFPAILARNADVVRQALSHALDRGIRVRLQQLGFENFSQPELDRLGKGISVEENVAAARLLTELSDALGDGVELFGGHGFILFTPWTRPSDIVQNVRTVANDAPFLADSLTPASRLCFYDPFNPIFRLAEREGLVVRVPHDYTLDFRYADPDTRRMLKLAAALEGHLVRHGAEAGSWLSTTVLRETASLFAGSDTTPRDPEALFRTAEARVRSAIA